MKLAYLGLFCSMLAYSADKIEKPRVVGTPPADGGRGLVRASKNEIRHYSGAKGTKGLDVLTSKDNGETWKTIRVSDNYPQNFGGHSKEAPAIERNPLTGEYIRVQKVNGIVFLSKGGLNGKWGAVTKDGKLDFDWKNTKNRDNYVKLGGLLRNPTFVNNGKRILVPGHGGSTHVHISDNGGLTWKRSKNSIGSPRHEIAGVHKGQRWQNGGVEGTIVELKDGCLWILVRTSQEQHWEAFSKDYGETWSKAQPSRFYGTLTMPFTARLKDGRLLALWTNTNSLPECYRSNREWCQKNGLKARGGEDAFTNRDSHHAAISHDDGKTWIGFREIIMDEYRNERNYATRHGSEDRGKHQSEMEQLDKNRVLISLGQHREHRRLMIMDTRWLYEKSRSNKFENGLDDWMHHTYVPIVKGHCAYNRKPSASLVSHNGKKAMLIKRLKDPELINETYKVNYEKAGATWNFPNGEAGTFSFSFTMNKGSEGTQLSLVDRLFNACDETVEQFAMYTINLKPGMKLGRVKLKDGKSYTLTFKWNGVSKVGKDICKVYLNGSKKPVQKLKLNNPSPNGISYVHFISTAEKEDTEILIESVKARTNGKSVTRPLATFSK